jgi:hypothetical protein
MGYPYPAHGAWLYRSQVQVKNPLHLTLSYTNLEKVLHVIHYGENPEIAVRNCKVPGERRPGGMAGVRAGAAGSRMMKIKE